MNLIMPIQLCAVNDRFKGCPTCTMVDAHSIDSMLREHLTFMRTGFRELADSLDRYVGSAKNEGHWNHRHYEMFEKFNKAFLYEMSKLKLYQTWDSELVANQLAQHAKLSKSIDYAVKTCQLEFPAYDIRTQSYSTKVNAQCHSPVSKCLYEQANGSLFQGKASGKNCVMERALDLADEQLQTDLKKLMEMNNSGQKIFSHLWLESGPLPDAVP